MPLRSGASIVGILLSVYLILGAIVMIRPSVNAYNIASTKEQLQRLVRASQRLANENPELVLDFWKSTGTAPWIDPWGEEFRQIRRESSQGLIAGWNSSGPDRQFNTSDDLFYPYEGVKAVQNEGISKATSAR